ncbi:hypothetical protein [Paeniglutamicibacter kerguelensis]|uniref:Uncharacterized protein n=1 Tax=Paeniglutamicibacter kerguelensis TaxID=254788 RepID=A0ABS4XCY3_9MICC|nr:hypothetical protein [Paeniglutamicibacter kerguelensis]MBP2386325.1 hypothetical protein [Paeniglutamicibacter kerguelensis]
MNLQRLVADDEGFPCGVDNLGSESVEVVERLDAFDLGQGPVNEAEVSAGDPDDGRDRGCVGEVALGVIGSGGYSLGEDGGEFLWVEWPLFVGESDTAVELGVAGEALLDAGLTLWI